MASCFNVNIKYFAFWNYFYYLYLINSGKKVHMYTEIPYVYIIINNSTISLYFYGL